MRSSCLVLATAVALALASTGAAQEEEEDFGGPGAYVGGGFVYGFQNFDLDDASRVAGTEISASGSPGLDVRGGYRFNQYLAVEGNLDYYAGFDLEAQGADDLSLYVFSFFASAKGYPLSGRIQPYGIFGIGFLAATVYDDYDFYYDSEDSDAVFALRAGGGVDVYVTPKFLLNLDVAYVITTSDMNFGGPADLGTDIIPLAFTAQYRF